MMQRVLSIIVALAATLGFAFAAVSTSDFVAHLDRQVHGIHCSFLPGADAPDVTGSSGCAVTLMSPYSSVLRESVWGGIPISLPAMALFAYLAFFALALLITRRTEDRRATAFLLASTTIPLLTSIVMGWIALRELDAACKLCIGIYASSTIAFVAALALAIRARRVAPALHQRLGPAPRIASRAKQGEETHDDAGQSHGTAESTVREESPYAMGTADTLQASPEQARRLATESEMERRLHTSGPAGAAQRRRQAPEAPAGAGAPVGWGVLGVAVAIGLAFVIVPVIAYAAGAPDFERYLGACGTLPSPADRHQVLVPLGPQTRPVQVVEVLDPLCPACRGFERRFTGLDAAEQVSRKVLLFPLDNACNWMVDRAIHPGACAISEAVLCAEDDAHEVIEWAFEHQEEIRVATEHDPGAAASMAAAQFPSLRSCIGSTRVRARLNLALRWAVANQLPVLTPQVYVGDTRICDADTDLGLDWTLSSLLERQSAGGTR